MDEVLLKCLGESEPYIALAETHEGIVVLTKLVKR